MLIYCINVQYYKVRVMQVRVVKMRNRGVEIDRRILRDATSTRGHLVIADITDQGLHRPWKVARLLKGEMIRAELKDVSLVWANENRMTLAGYEKIQNEAGQPTDYRQSWLIFLDVRIGAPEQTKRKVSANS